MSSKPPDNPRQHQSTAELSLSTDHITFTSAEEYERDQYIQRLRLHEQISSWVIAFFGIHAFSFIICCMGVAFVLGMHGEFSMPVSLLIIGLGWLVSMAAAIYVAWIAFAHWRQLRWNWLLFAGLPWGVLCFEALIVMIPILA